MLVRMPGFRPRVVVTGSRVWGVHSEDPKFGSSRLIAYVERSVTFAALTAALRHYGDEMILVHGCARGADAAANAWAMRNLVLVEDHPADWKRLGRGAGPFRNAQMIAVRTELVMAFWTRDHKDPTKLSSGTKGMIEMTRRRGIPVVTYRSPFWAEWSDLPAADGLAAALA